MKRESTFRYFTDSTGRLYKKETDYANRSWWYVCEFEYGYVANWRIHDGKPMVDLTERKESEIF